MLLARWKEVRELLKEATAEVAEKGAELLHFQTMHLGLGLSEDFKNFMGRHVQQSPTAS